MESFGEKYLFDQVGNMLDYQEVIREKYLFDQVGNMLDYQGVIRYLEENKGCHLLSIRVPTESDWEKERQELKADLMYSVGAPSPYEFHKEEELTPEQLQERSRLRAAYRAEYRKNHVRTRK